MLAVLQSEVLKLKKSGTIRLSLIVACVAPLIAYLIGGIQIFVSFSIYWWEAVFLFLLMGLLFLSDKKAEEKAGNFQNIMLNLPSEKIYRTKILLILGRVLLASAVLLVLLYLFSFVYQSIISVDIVRTGLALLTILIAAAWNLPFLYFLSRWLSPYLVLAGNTLICLLIAPMVAQTSYWFLFPYTYHYKAAELLLAVKPSGDTIYGAFNVNLVMVIVPVILSLIMALVFGSLLNRRKSRD